MPKVLIVYGSSYGQTEKIAWRVADQLEVGGVHTVVRKGDVLPADARLEEYDGFVVAGSVLYGKHQRYLAEFVRRHLALLNQRPSAFISVCGALMGNWPPGQEEARKYLANFLQETGWTPQFTRSLPGGLPYTRYGLITRWIMKGISRKTGRPVDTRRDWDFTDWPAVDRFAAEFGESLGGGVPAVAARG
jgi:menaquinone-dependent protoporphyrinogen oxidase